MKNFVLTTATILFFAISAQAQTNNMVSSKGDFLVLERGKRTLFQSHSNKVLALHKLSIYSVRIDNGNDIVIRTKEITGDDKGGQESKRYFFTYNNYVEAMTFFNQIMDALDHLTKGTSPHSTTPELRLSVK